MAICKHCKREMLSADSCVLTPVEVKGKKYSPIPFGKEIRFGEDHINPAERCHDCNVAYGGYHHSGCDVEECPVCHKQLIGCDCTDNK